MDNFVSGGDMQYISDRLISWEKTWTKVNLYDQSKNKGEWGFNLKISFPHFILAISSLTSLPPLPECYKLIITVLANICESVILLFLICFSFSFINANAAES